MPRPLNLKEFKYSLPDRPPPPRQDYRGVLFADLHQGELSDINDYLFDKEGRRCVRIRFYPFPTLIRAYAIDNKEIDSWGTIEKTYLYDNIMYYGNWIVVMVTYHNGPGIFTEMLKEKQQTINLLTKENEGLKVINNGFLIKYLEALQNNTVLASKHRELADFYRYHEFKSEDEKKRLEAKK